MRFPIIFCAIFVSSLVLVLANRAALPANPGAQAHDEPIVRCDAEAYVTDKDPNGLNVRSGPAKTSNIVGNLSNQKVEGIRVHMTGASGEWIRIDHAVENGAEVDHMLFDGTGWVYGPLLGVSGEAITKGGTTLYLAHSTTSRVVAIVPGGSELVVHGCNGGWIYVQYKEVKGWGAPKTLCANPLTTCV